MTSLTNKNILLISPEAWGKSWVSKHHYALSLANRGNRVYFLNPGIDPSLIYQPIGNTFLFVLGDVSVPKGLRYLPKFLRSHFIKKAIQQLESKCEVSFDVVWTFDSSRYFDLTCFKNALRIFHMMDYRYDFNLPIISKSAHLCLGVTNEIVSKQKNYNPHSFFLQHAFHSYDQTLAKLHGGEKNLKVFYAGNLLLRFIDRTLVLTLVTEFPEVHFYFAGSYESGNLNSIVTSDDKAFIQALSAFKNVFLLGERSPNELLSLMSEADVLLLFYDSKRYPLDVANSHKIVSYLSSGKVILANRTRQYENLGLLEMAETHEEYISKMREILRKPEVFNSPEEQAKRTIYAEDHTYEKQIQKIEKILGTLPL
jgi:hypothetical protein